jgi:hypothetical protein
MKDVSRVVDAYRTKRAGAMGAGVFLLLLAAGGLHDIVTGKTQVWGAVGISTDAVESLTVVFAVVGTALFAGAIWNKNRASREAETELERLEQELASLIPPRSDD